MKERASRRCVDRSAASRGPGPDRVDGSHGHVQDAARLVEGLLEGEIAADVRADDVREVVPVHEGLLVDGLLPVEEIVSEGRDGPPAEEVEAVDRVDLLPQLGQGLLGLGPRERA